MKVRNCLLFFLYFCTETPALLHHLTACLKTNYSVPENSWCIKYNSLWTATQLYAPFLHDYFICVWLTLSRLTLTPFSTVVAAVLTGEMWLFPSHLNFTDPFTSPFNLVHNDAIKKKPIWAFFGEGGYLPKLSTLMFFPSCRQQMLGKKQIHSPQLP